MKKLVAMCLGMILLNFTPPSQLRKALIMRLVAS